MSDRPQVTSPADAALLAILTKMNSMSVSRVFSGATVRGFVEKSKSGDTAVQTHAIAARRPRPSVQHSIERHIPGEQFVVAKASEANERGLIASFGGRPTVAPS
jgi:hypothetical protein